MISIHIFICIFSLLIQRIKCYDTALQDLLADEFNATSIQYPSVDFSSFNNDKLMILGYGGDVTLMSYVGQQNFTTNSSFSGQDIIYFNSNEGLSPKYIKLGSTPNGTITKITSLNPTYNDCFILSGTGTIQDKSLAKQVLFNLSSLQYSEIFDQDLVSVNSVLVDSDVVYFGGNFTYNNGHSAAMWNITANKTANMPFGGFGNISDIRSILKINNGSILFTGQFDTLDDTTYLEKTEYFTYENSTTTNQTIVVTNTSISSNSTIQVQQMASLKYATFNDNGDSAFNSEEEFMCPELFSLQSSHWSGSSDASTFSLSFLDTVNPSKIRIYISETSPVSSFRLLLPNGGIVELEYLDPFTNTLITCDATCPLFSNITESGTKFLSNNITSISFNPNFQDFALFPVLPMSGLTFQSLSGQAGSTSVSISGMQIFQSDFFVYANNTLNEPGCSDISEFSSSIISSSNWEQGQRDASYIISTIDDDLPYVEYYPQINIIGNYSFDMYTPGCTSDDTCSSRGIVNATVYYKNDQGIAFSESTIIYQNNDDEKYNNVFTGYLDAAPTVRLEYVSGLSDGISIQVMVADRLSITALSVPNPTEVVTTSDISTSGVKNNTEISSKNVSLSLNGLLEYSTSNFSNSNLNASMKIGNTSLNFFTTENFYNRGLNDFNLLSTFSNDTLILSSSNFEGIAKLGLDESNQVISDTNLNTGGTVTAVGAIDNGIQFLFGSFDIDGSSLSSLYYDGSFNTLSNFKTNYNITDFQILDTRESLIFVFNNEYFFNWTSQSTLDNSSYYDLSLWSSSSNSNGDTILSGGIFDQSIVTSTSGSINISGSLENISQLSLEDSDSFTYYYATFINETTTAYAVQSANNETTVLLINSDSNTTSELPVSYKNDTVISNMIYSNDVLGISTNSSDLYTYNITAVATISDESLNDTSAVVNSMIYFDQNSTMLVCGSFIIGSCDGICLFDILNKKWNTFSKNEIAGNISKCQLDNDGLLLLAGDIKVSGSTHKHGQLLSLNLTSLETSFYPSLNTTVDTFTVSSDNTVFAVSNNKSQISYYDGSSWNNISNNNIFENTTIFNNLITLIGSSNGTSKRELPDKDVLLVTGSLNTYFYGHQFAMLYDNSGWIPYLSVTGPVYDTSSVQLFPNKDISKFYSTNSTLQPSTRPSASATAKPTVEKKTHSKMDRGYVVLLGLALSIATIALMGLILLITLMVWRSITQRDMESFSSRINEKTMLETLPPDQLMKHIGTNR